MLRNFLKKLLIIIFELAVIMGALWYIAQKKNIDSVDQIIPALEKTVQSVQQKEPSFPELSNPQARSFNWDYKGKKYLIDLSLYQSVYDYYGSQPKEYTYIGSNLPNNWEEKYYSMFLKINDTDKTIEILAQEIRSLGKKQGLSDDQIIDLAIAFVQSIPYDDAKAKNILTKTGSEKMQYPYETLYKKIGVCSDKSILAYAIFREMGYGVALMAYEQNNHMAVGIQCPKNYSTYESGYCYAETTSVGNKVGIIPSIDMQSNKTIDLSEYSLDQVQQMNLQELGQVKIFLPTEGKQYLGIIETEKISVEISQLKKSAEALLFQIQSQKSIVTQEEKELKDIENDLEKYKKDENFEKYNSLAEKFNKLLGDYKKNVKRYNDSVTLYNQYIKKYNALIRQ